MREIKHTIKDAFGMHARPAGQFVKTVSAFKSDVKLRTAAGKEVDAKRIMGVMSLGLKQNDVMTITFTGADEANAATATAAFLTENI
ncbi:phosphocarrier protein HPr [Clostridia bacterium]|nr:phosphocarrier protein HPr [Clostridia bacterium]